MSPLDLAMAVMTDRPPSPGPQLDAPVSLLLDTDSPMDLMSVDPPGNMLKPDPRCDNLWRWSLWEVIRSWVGNLGGTAGSDGICMS